MKSDAELRHERWVLGLNKGFDTAKQLIKWGGIVWVASYARDAITSLAGQTTLADIAVSVLVSASTREKIAYPLVVLALIWGWCERKLRRDKIKVMSRRIGHLESQLDLGRSSSQLTTTGETREEDK